MSTAGGSAAEHATRLAAGADQVALCLDFDGTLSPIVDDEVDQVNLRTVTRTLPGKQFEVARALRVRVAVAFQLAVATWRCPVFCLRR